MSTGFHSDDLADAIVEYFRDLADPPLDCGYENPAEEIVLDAELAEWKTFVWPAEETEESLDRGDMCRELLAVDVFVHGPISHPLNRRRAIEQVRFLRESLRETTFSGFRWQKNELVSGVFDAGVLRGNKQFLTMFRATFYNFG